MNDRPAASAPPLEVVGLTRRFGDFVAVDRLDLRVERGEILGFLGPNGAGKTTTLRLCAGLLRPDAGQIRIAGLSLDREPLRARAAFGFVPDRPYLYERLSGSEFLELIAALYSVPAHVAEERSASLLREFRLVDALADPVETYSLGMRQKLAVVAALLHDPALALLDEPLTGLDPHSARALKDELRERADRGLGVLVSTHLLDVAERLCDRAVILHHGRRVADGTLEGLRGADSDATLEDVFLELTSEREG